MQPERKWEHIIVLVWQKTTPNVFVLIDNESSCLCVGHGYLNILCREEVNSICYGFRKTNNVSAFASQVSSWQKIVFATEQGIFQLSNNFIDVLPCSEIRSLHCWGFFYLKNRRTCLTVPGKSATVSCTMNINMTILNCQDLC